MKYKPPPIDVPPLSVEIHKKLQRIWPLKVNIKFDTKLTFLKQTSVKGGAKHTKREIAQKKQAIYINKVMFDRTNNTFPKANKVKFERHLYSRVRRSYLSLIILIYFKIHTKNPHLNTGLISLFIIIYDICVDVIAYFYIQHLSITSYHFDMYLDIIACILADASTLKMFDKHDLS